MSAPSFSSFPAPVTQTVHLPSTDPVGANTASSSRPRERPDDQAHRARKRRRDTSSLDANGRGSRAGPPESSAYSDPDLRRTVGRDDGRLPRDEVLVTSETVKDLFIDSVGEPNVRRYGPSTAGTNFKYRREAAGRLLGLAGMYRSVSTGSKEEAGLEVAKAGQLFIRRYTAKAWSRQEHLCFGGLAVELSGSELYVGFHDSASHNRETEQRDDIQEQVRHFEMLLSASPSDVQTWSRYAHAHQSGSGQTATPQEREVTLSILARALEVVPPERALALHLDFMGTAEPIWTTARLHDRWWALIDRLPKMAHAVADLATETTMLLREYLDWLEGPGFGQKGTMLDDVIGRYGELLHRLQVLPFSSTAAGERCRIDLVFRLCLLLRKTGYHEKALAIALTLCEVTFFKPEVFTREATSTNFAAVLSSFEDFWDSGYPRLGEKGARGWKDARPTGLEDRKEPSEDPLVDISDPFLRWATTESRLESCSSRAVRANDLDVEEDDPFRLVVFDDVRQWLIPLIAPESWDVLFSNTLGFLGLPVGIPMYNSSAAQFTTTYREMTSATLEAWESTAAVLNMSDHECGWAASTRSDNSRCRDVSPFQTIIKSWAAGPHTLLATQWFKNIDASAVSGLNIDMIRNLFDLCGPVLNIPDIGSLSLAFESAISLKGALKISKSALSADRNDLSLWRNHARLERMRGRLSAARVIYSTALAQSSTTAQGDANLDLWADWASMEWAAGDTERASGVLFALVDYGPTGHLTSEVLQPLSYSPLTKLKARQFYQPGPLPSSFPWFVLLTLYRYREGLQGALDVCQQQIDATRSLDPARELAHQWRAEVLFRHSTTQPSIGSEALRLYRQSMDEFPHNTQFPTLALYQESKSGLQGRVYAFATAHMTRARTTNDIIWAVWAFARHSPDVNEVGSASHTRLRAMLLKALSTKIGARSVALWRMAIGFEVSSGNLDNGKQLLYRSLSARGSSKELYMLAFRPALRSSFSDRELKQLADLMTERDLRIRKATSDFWDPLSPPDSPVSLDSPEVADDELQVLRDEEALKPYK